MKKTKYDMVIINWIDSKGVTSNWEFIDDMDPVTPAETISIGFLLEENKKYKTIAQNISNDQVLGRMTIPSCAITGVRRLK